MTLLVHHLVHGDGAANVALEIVERDLLLFQTLVELFLVLGRFDLVELAIDFLLGGQQAEFLGSAHHHLIVDHLPQNIQA